MGFISGGTCVRELSITYTEKGKEYLSGMNPDKTGLNITHFALSDSDINYTIYYKLCLVPDVTGMDQCVGATKINDLKYKLSVTGDTSGVSIIQFNPILVDKNYCCD